MQGFMFLLAPMEGVTTSAFRAVCHRYGADLTYTPMARMDGLARGNRATWERLDTNGLSTPVVIQLIGTDPGALKKFLDRFEPPDGLWGLDLNLGCSSPDYVGIGQGAAMVKRVTRTAKLADIIRSAGHRVSVKLRLGLNAREKSKRAYLNLMNGVDADLFVVHARHGGQMLSDPVDETVYQACVDTGKAVVANGDIATLEQVQRLREAGLRGVMIGRGAISDPGIFARLKGCEAPSASELIDEYRKLARELGEVPPAGDVSVPPRG